VVIMTSNLGNQLWEGGQTVTRDAITQVLQAHFRLNSSTASMRS